LFGGDQPLFSEEADTYDDLLFDPLAGAALPLVAIPGIVSGVGDSATDDRDAGGRGAGEIWELEEVGCPEAGGSGEVWELEEVSCSDAGGAGKNGGADGSGMGTGPTGPGGEGRGRKPSKWRGVRICDAASSVFVCIEADPA
jgi:hypothetical protein